MHMRGKRFLRIANEFETMPDEPKKPNRPKRPPPRRPAKRVPKADQAPSNQTSSKQAPSNQAPVNETPATEPQSKGSQPVSQPAEKSATVSQPTAKPIESTEKTKPAAVSPATTAAAADTSASVSTIGNIQPPTPMEPANPEAAVVDHVDDEGSGAGFLMFTAMPSWLASTIVHVIVLLLLAMLTRVGSMQEEKRELVLSNISDEPAIEELDEFEPAEDLEMDEMEIETELPSMDSETPVESFEVAPAEDITAAASKVELDPAGIMTAPSNLLTQTTNQAMSGDALSGRAMASRKRMVREGGGNKASEAAVMMALEWLAQHQLPDGGWNIDHRLGPCKGRCGNPGTREPARFGATGLALLPFLGAGNTHEEGPYKEVVARGLQFLIRNIKLKGPSGRLFDEGNYYSHGLCTIAICEAFAMTKDRSLMVPAQSLVNEIAVAQDRAGGGWRYKRGQAGDTSVLGWLVMALKSADMAYLQINPNSLVGAKHFLDTVQHDNGARYRYAVLNSKGQVGTSPKSAMSAVGLLMRMYMGWQPDNEVLQDGLARLGEMGPSVGKKPNLYYNYYATQVMHHFHKPDAPEWQKWNEKMRDFLVEAQERDGHMAGSWHWDTDAGHAEAGGRLYLTSLSTMILEVYYRHMPLYQSDAAEDEFEL